MPPNLMICLLDTLRLDYFQRMERANQAMENAGFTFLDYHWSVAHCSDPNISTMLTGFGPWQSNITTQMGSDFKDKIPAVFWRFKKEFPEGYSWGIQPVKVPGFYRYYLDEVAWQAAEDVADLELRAVKAFVQEAGDRPWLGFFRDFTMHYPYNGKEIPERGNANAIVPQYQEAADHIDQFIINLLDFVLSEHPNTIILVCSDHGELLGEHGEWDHLYTLYSILTRTPMAIYAPGLSGRHTDHPTQHIDLMPTICDLYGWTRQGEGMSWLPWMRGETKHPSRVDREMHFQGTGAGPTTKQDAEERGRLIDPGVARVLWRHRAVVAGEWKLVENVHAGGTRGVKLTKAGDYIERNEYARKRQHIVKKMYGNLPPVPDYHDWEQEIIAPVTEKRKREDRIVLERLRALGYA